MAKGLRSVYAKLLTLDGKIVSDKISRFSYKYAEKKDDICLITLEASTPDIIDNPNLVENHELKVIWGYLGTSVVSTRKIFIKEVTPSFTAAGVIIKLKGSDKYSALNQMQDDSVYSNSTLGDIVDDKANKSGLVVEYHGFRVPKRFDSSNGQVLYARDNAIFPQMVLIPELPQANRTDKDLIDEAASLSGDDILVEGRDSSVIIRKRDYNQNPIHVLHYASGTGEFLSLNIKTQNEKSSAFQTQIKSKAWDGATKKFNEVKVDQSKSESVRTGDLVKLPKDETPINELAKQLSKNTPVNPPVGKRSTNKIAYPNGYVTPGIFTDKDGGQETVAYLEFGGPVNAKHLGTHITAARESTAFVVDGIAPIAILNGVDGIDLQVPSAVGDLNKKLAEGTLTVVGHSRYISGKILTLLNVSKKYSGNWYIEEAEHDFNGGYTCILKIFKNAVMESGDSEELKKLDDATVNNKTSVVDSNQKIINQKNV